MRKHTRTAVQCNDPFRCPHCDNSIPLTDYHLNVSSQPLFTVNQTVGTVTVIFGAIIEMTCPTCDRVVGEWVLVSPDDVERIK